METLVKTKNQRDLTEPIFAVAMRRIGWQGVQLYDRIRARCGQDLFFLWARVKYLTECISLTDCPVRTSGLVIPSTYIHASGLICVKTTGVSQFTGILRHNSCHNLNNFFFFLTEQVSWLD